MGRGGSDGVRNGVATIKLTAVNFIVACKGEVDLGWDGWDGWGGERFVSLIIRLGGGADSNFLR